MQHPSKDAIYCLSYLRSGSSWFRYCFKYITETEVDKELLFHSHRIANHRWTLENTFDIKNILLLRNYKECIISEMKNTHVRPPEEMNERCMELFTVPLTAFPTNQAKVVERMLFAFSNYIEIMKHMALKFDPTLRKFTSDDWGHRFKERDKPGYHNPALKVIAKIATEGITVPQAGTGNVSFQITTAFHNYTVNTYRSMEADMGKVFGDFILSGFPLFDSGLLVKKVRNFPIESVLSLSAPNHYHFALQLIRYYELLEYHNKVSKANPNNALVIKYEDFIEDPFTELSKVIDFMEEARLATSDHINMYRDNLHKLVDDIDPHKFISVRKYRNRPETRTGFLAHSYGRDPEYNFHSSICRKEFLIEIDNVLKNKNLELYNQYLSDYEEKAD